MIVTADPVGDFNATSQILRYSALAREVTVPRIPSVSSTILAGLNSSNDNASQRSPSAGSQTSPRGAAEENSMVDMAFSEIARLQEELELLNVRLADEETRRREVETNWQRAEERADDLEIEIREECWAEMEDKMAEEKRRWINAWEDEAEKNEEHLDRKLEIMEKGMTRGDDGSSAKARGVKNGAIDIYEDDTDTREYIENLERENELLKAKLEAFERDLQTRSPTKKQKTKNVSRNDHYSDDNNQVDEQDASDMIHAYSQTSLSSPRKSKPTRQPPKLPSLGLGSLIGADAGAGGDDSNVFGQHASFDIDTSTLDTRDAEEAEEEEAGRKGRRTTTESSFLNSLNGLSSSTLTSPTTTTSSTTTAIKTPMKSSASSSLFTSLDTRNVANNSYQRSPLQTPRTSSTTTAGKTLTTTTGKKIRKLTARKWDLMDENELEGYGF